MFQDTLMIGNKIDVRRIDSYGRPIHIAKTYVSQLLDFIAPDMISIATPMGNSIMIMLEVGANYQLCFYTSKGLYQCNCVIVKNYKENNMMIAVTKVTSNLEKFQRRQYFRLECIHEMEYRIITIEEDILENRIRKDNFINSDERSECRKKLNQMDKEWVKASITDISGGGAKFNSHLMHQPGDNVRIKVDFIIAGELKKLVLGAELIYSSRLINQSGAFEHRVEFKDIGKKDREDLIKYIFEQERRRRRNDKG